MLLSFYLIFYNQGDSEYHGILENIEIIECINLLGEGRHCTC